MHRVLVVLVFPTDSNVVEVREDGIEIVLFNKFHHLALKTSGPICDTKWQTCELIEIVTCFEGGVLLIFFLERDLMVGAP